MIPDWFAEVVAEELARLFSINLAYSPAADVLPTTIRSWTADLYHHFKPGPDDRVLVLPRLRVGFRALRLKSKTWPSPAQFIEHVPPRTEQLRLGRTTSTLSAAERERRLIRIANDRETMGLKPLALMLPPEEEQQA